VSEALKFCFGIILGQKRAVGDENIFAISRKSLEIND